MQLKEFFAENPYVALGFSGGVDSSYLLYAAIKSGARVGAYYMESAFQPRFQLDDAERLAEELGADFSVHEVDVLNLKDVAENGPERCYYCKKAMFALLCGQAARDGFPLVIDGTNASDAMADRPGMRALMELGVRSPLRECGLTKENIRELSKEAGLFTWDKPAYSCLATRIQGEPITAAALKRVEYAENALQNMEFSNLRVRLRGETAIIQLPEPQILRAATKRKEILERMKPYFKNVLLDLEERK